MSKFFINRPIVAMVISILMVIVGVVASAGTANCPVPQYRGSADPGEGDLPRCGRPLTVQQSVAVPIEQQMSGVDNMGMYSLNANNGNMT